MKVSATKEKPFLYLAAQGSYSVPEFHPHQSIWEKEFNRATWLHSSLGKDQEKSPKKFQSAFLLPIDRNLTKFQSSLPIIVIDVPEFPPHLRHTYQDCFWGIIAPSQDLPFPGEFTASGRGGIRARGSSSRSQRKLPLALEFRDWKGKDLPQAILDFPASSDWILSPPSDLDPSLIRNPLVFSLSRDCGQYAPHTQFVDVFLNVGNRQLDYRGDYFGVFALTERIQAGQGKIELDPSPDVHAENAHGLSQGLVFKYDRPGRGEVGLQIGEFETTFYFTSPNESKLRYQDAIILENLLNDFALALKSPTGQHPKTGKPFRGYIDAPSWHTWRWLGELTKNLDLYRASTYFHLPVSGPEAGLIKAGPVWDFDRSIDSLDERDNDPHGWTGGETWLPALAGQAPWWHYLLKDAQFRIEHCRHWQELRKGPLKWANIEAHLKEYSDELTRVDSISNKPHEAKSPIQRDTKKWLPSRRRQGSFEGEITHMSDWLQKRLLWLDQRVDDILTEKEPILK